MSAPLSGKAVNRPITRPRNLRSSCSFSTPFNCALHKPQPLRSRREPVCPTPAPLCGKTANVPVLPETVCGKTGTFPAHTAPGRTPLNTFRSCRKTFRTWRKGFRSLRQSSRSSRKSPGSCRKTFPWRPEAGGEARRGDWSSHPRTASHVLSGSADPQPARPQPTSRCSFPGQKMPLPKTTDYTDNKRIAQVDHSRFPGPARAVQARFFSRVLRGAPGGRRRNGSPSAGSQP
jgi:hypothetical protein